MPGVLLAVLALGRPGYRWVATGLLAFGWAAGAAHHRLAEWLPAELGGHDFAVVGWVDGFPTGSAERKTFSLRVARAEDPVVPERLRLAWYDAPDFLEPGTSLALTVRLRRPRGFVNPAGFDYERWLLTAGYGATGYVRSGRAVVPERFVPAREWLRLRARIAAEIRAAAPTESSAALITALAIGERYAFTDEQWTDLQGSGTSHLVAISGMHVGLIATLVFGAVRRLWLRLPGGCAGRDLEAAATASAAAACGYAALAGFGLPTQRAVIMVAVALAVLVSRRTVSAANGLAVAALAVLVLDPFAPASASFWMSFGAVALLLALGARREVAAAPRTGPAGPFRGPLSTLGRAGKSRRFAQTLIRLQAGISLGAIPVAALYFGRVSLVAPLANLIAIPYFSFLLVPLTLAGALGLAGGVPGAAGLVRAAASLADWAWAGIHFAAAPGMSALGVAAVGPWTLLLGLAGVAAALPAHPLPGRNWAWCALLPILLPPAHRPAPGTVEIEMLDVGHGLAVIVETRHHRLLYDAGPRFPSGYDTGREIVVPALSLDARAGLDRLVVSHADADHAGGAAAVLAAFPEADVLHGPDVTSLPGRPCRRGQRWRWDGVEFTMLHPPPGFPDLGNDSSCVLKIATAGGSVLLAGDVEARAEALLAEREDIAADVVAVPHHGSSTSSTPSFVARTEARVALVSSAYASRWRFPRPAVVARWRTAGAELWVTGAAGALKVTLHDEEIEVSGERARRRRYWRTFSRSPPGTGQDGAL